MGGLAATKKNIPATKAEHTVMVCDNLFFRHVCRVADIGRKELAYSLRVSRGLVDFWFNGTKRDPFTIARDAMTEIVAKRPDLRAAVLAYIAGKDGFDDALFARLSEVFRRVQQ